MEAKTTVNVENAGSTGNLNETLAKSQTSDGEKQQSQPTRLLIN